MKILTYVFTILLIVSILLEFGVFGYGLFINFKYCCYCFQLGTVITIGSFICGCLAMIGFTILYKKGKEE